MPSPSDPPPEYRKYRAGPRFLRRGPRDGGSLLDDLRGGDGNGAPPLAPPPGAGPGHEGDDAGRRDYGRRAPRVPGLPRRRRRTRLPRGPISAGRVVKWVVLAVVGWLALSLVLF